MERAAVGGTPPSAGGRKTAPAAAPRRGWTEERSRGLVGGRQTGRAAAGVLTLGAAAAHDGEAVAVAAPT